MKTIVRVLVPAVLALGIVGQAGAREILVETEYPGPTATASGMAVASTQSEPYLIQSNSEGPRVNPVYATRSATASRSAPEVRAEATIAVPYGPAMNA